MLFECQGNYAPVSTTDADAINPNDGTGRFSVVGPGMSGFWSINGPNAQAVVGYLGNRGPGWGNPPRHDGNQASNFLLCDGHVKSMMPNQVSSGWNPPSPNTAEDNGAATPAPPQTGVCTQNDFAEGTSSNQYLATFSGV